MVAVVQMRPGHPRDDDALLAEAGRHVARDKLPKAVIYVDEIVRSPSGKADYRWAGQVVDGQVVTGPTAAGPA